MKPKEYIKKYKLDIIPLVDSESFIQDLTQDFYALIDQSFGWKNIKGFNNASRAIRGKWDGINTQIHWNLSESTWGRFNEHVILKRKQELFPDECKQEKEQERESERVKREQNQWEDSAFGGFGGFYDEKNARQSGRPGRRGNSAPSTDDLLKELQRMAHRIFGSDFDFGNSNFNFNNNQSNQSNQSSSYQSSSNLTVDAHFRILKLNIKTATLMDVKKSFRKLAMEHHPDKGGNAEEFGKITESKNVCEKYFS